MRIDGAPSVEVIRRVSVYPAQHESGIDSTKSERIGENVLDSLCLSCSRQKVKVACFIGNGEIESRGQPLALDCDRIRATGASAGGQATEPLGSAAPCAYTWSGTGIISGGITMARFAGLLDWVAAEW